MALLPAGAYGTDVARPSVARSSDGVMEWTFNDPRAYAWAFDRLACTRARLERAMGMSVADAVALAASAFAYEPVAAAATERAVARMGDAAAAAQHVAALARENAPGDNPRKALLLAFESWEHLNRGRSMRSRTADGRARNYTVMLDRPPPARGLFAPFRVAHAWTLGCYVAGASVLIYLSACVLANPNMAADDEGEEGDADAAAVAHTVGRVFVADATACAPLLTVCPICAVRTGRPLYRCRGCKWVLYCGAEHKRAHWSEHAAVCGAYARLTGLAEHPGAAPPAGDAPPRASSVARASAEQRTKGREADGDVCAFEPVNRACASVANAPTQK